MYTTTESFFNLFDFFAIEHQAMNATIVYESCKITKDIETRNGQVLKVGTEFDQVNFYIKLGQFHFITWKPSEDCSEYIPNETSVLIPQGDLAAFLMWD